MWFWSLRPVKNRFFIDKNRFLAIQVSIRIDTAYQVLSPSLVLSHYNKRLFIIQMGSNNMIKIFRINKSGDLGEAYNGTKIKIY